MKTNFLTRIRLISAFIFLFALLLLGRLYFLQIVDHGVYLGKANRQYSSSSDSIFDRGTIFFQSKDGDLIPAATLQSGFIVAINPEVLADPETVYQKLNAILPIDHDTFISKATKKNDSYEEITTKVSTDIGQKISDLKIKGLDVYDENWRFYPGSDMASRTIGIMAYLGNDYAGRYGLESQYDSVLERTDESDVNFFAELFSDIKSQESGQGEATLSPA